LAHKEFPKRKAVKVSLSWSDRNNTWSLKGRKRLQWGIQILEAKRNENDTDLMRTTNLKVWTNMKICVFKLEEGVMLWLKITPTC